MKNTIVIGMQFGDEGKGKYVDILAGEHDVIVRYQGGGNAGHTVVINNEEYKLHLIPSGILRKGKINIIGNNVVLDLTGFFNEFSELQERGVEINPENLRISSRAHLTLAYHKQLDEAGGGKIGTTGRGIGPTYEDKVARRGIRLCDLFENDLEEKVKTNLKFANHMLRFHNARELNLDEVLNELLLSREKIRPFVEKDIGKLILQHNGSLLFEGAQGTLLDIDHGTYPFVTSSNTTIGGAYTGAGVYVNFDRRIGVLKAYTTRVGNGPFPTEQNNKTGERLRARGGEFGTTTGRARRCGWLDLFAASYSARINGINELSLAKLDVLDTEKNILLCVGYSLNKEKVDYFPEQLEKCIPIYEEIEGWEKDISGARKLSDLPTKAREYIDRIVNFLHVPTGSVGVGKEREQMILI